MFQKYGEAVTVNLVKICTMLMLLGASFGVALGQQQADSEKQLEAVPVNLTNEELQWISENPVIKVTSKLNTAPNEFIRAGSPVGFSIDYMNLVAENVGLEIEYIYGYQWSELLAMLENREIDVSHNIFQNDEREQYLTFTEPYMNLEPAFFGLAGSTPVHGIEDLRGKRIGVVAGWALDGAYRQKFPSLEFVNIANSLDAALKTIDGEIDLFIATKFIAESIIETNFITNVEMVGTSEFLEVSNNEGARIAVRNDWPILHSILSKGMAAITEEQYIGLNEKWLMPASQVSDIDLSEEEVAWLDQNKVVKVVVDQALLPLESIDENGEISGISGDYLKLISEKLNIRFEWVGNETFAEGVELIHSDEADMISIYSETGDRTDYMIFTEGYMTLDLVIFGRLGEDVYGDMNGLYGRTVAMPKGWDTTDWIRRDYPGINVVETSNKTEALRLVSGGVVDAHIGSVSTTSYNLVSQNINNMVVAGVTPYSTSISMGIRADLPHLASSMIKALNSITVTERNEISQKWIVLRNEETTDYTLVWQILLAAAALFALIMVWNYSLRQEVERRKSSEERFRQIAETVDGVFFICEADLSKVKYMSPSFSEWTNLSCDVIYEHAGKWLKFVHPNDQKIFKQSVDRAIESGFTSRLPDYRIIDCNGKTRWIATQAHPIYDENRELASVVGFMTDITTRIRSRAKLSEINNQFQNAFNHASHGMALVGTDGKFQRVNSALCEILGYEDYELLELDVKSITHPDDINLSMTLMREVIDGERLSFQLEKQHIRKNGAVVPTQLNVSMVRDNKGRPIHFVAQVQDLSTLKEREEQLRQSQKMDAVGKLTGGIAHDFNNILGIILGNLEILQATMPEEPTAQQRLEKALKGVDRGSSLIKKLLSFSRNTQPNTGPINANESVLNLIDLIKRTFKASITVKDQLDENLWPIDVDSGELDDAILNLALNARDAMEGDGELTIKTENVVLDEQHQNRNPGSQLGDHVVISVTDTGVGIDDEHMDKILEPFFTTKPVHKGTGLGLSMVHGFVQRSNGHMKVFSEKGKGATFKIYIPRSKAVSSLENQLMTGQEKLPKGSETILIVDDEKHLCDIARTQLTDLGYSVYTASSASNALELLSKNKNVDLLFSDIVMPDNQDGYKMASSALKINPYLKILLTSGYSKDLDDNVYEDSELFTNLSSNLLHKPYNRKDLAIAIRRSLDQ